MALVTMTSVISSEVIRTTGCPPRTCGVQHAIAEVSTSASSFVVFDPGCRSQLVELLLDRVRGLQDQVGLLNVY
jgi:hypothetical protein